MDKNKKSDSFLRKIREINSLTLIELAEKAKVSYATISNLESRRRIAKSSNGKVKEETVQNLAKALQIKSDTLYYHFGVLPPNVREIAKEYPIFFMKTISKVYKDLENPKIAEIEKSFMDGIYESIRERKTETLDSFLDS